MNRKEATVGFAWNFLFGLPSKLLFPILGILIARILGPDEIGVFAVLTTVLAISDIFRDAGLGNSYIADKEADRPEREGAYHALAILTAAILALIVFLARDAIAGFFAMPELSWGLQIVAFALLANGFITIPVAKLQRQARFRDAGIIQTLSGLISYGVAVPLAFTGIGFQALVWGLLARALLYWGLAHYTAPTKLTAIERSFLSSVFGRSSAIFSQNLLYSVYTILDNALITKLFGKSAIGFYSIAWNLGIKPVEFISFPLSSTLFVAYTRYSGDQAKFASVFCRSLAAASLISLPLFAFIGLFAHELIVVLYTAKFSASIPLLQMLSVYFAFRSLGTLAGSAMVAANRAYLNVASWLSGFAVAAAGLGANWGSLTLGTAVLWITIGACCAYGLTLALAFWKLKPGAADLRKVWMALVISLLPALACFGIRQVPMREVLALFAGFAVVIGVQAFAVGVILGGSPFAVLSRTGVRRIWNSL
ncbi:MAG: oligosaccharide flippase family protein [Fimbriimonadaceae bacterium]